MVRVVAVTRRTHFGYRSKISLMTDFLPLPEGPAMTTTCLSICNSYQVMEINTRGLLHCTYGVFQYSRMEVCASIFLTKSRTTETTMRSAVPPMVIEVMPVTPCNMIGSTAKIPRKSAPTSVMRVMMLPRYSDVVPPGRTPGINAPFFWRFFAIWLGSKVIAV